MSSFVDLIDRYIAAWNETDAPRRRELIARTWTEDATYVDPLMRGAGRAGIDAMIQSAQTRFQGLQFRRTSEVDTHNNYVRFSWELGPEEGPALAGGIDFGVTVGDHLQTITGFLDFMPHMAGSN